MRNNVGYYVLAILTLLVFIVGVVVFQSSPAISTLSEALDLLTSEDNFKPAIIIFGLLIPFVFCLPLLLISAKRIISTIKFAEYKQSAISALLLVITAIATYVYAQMLFGKFLGLLLLIGLVILIIMSGQEETKKR